MSEDIWQMINIKDEEITRLEKELAISRENHIDANRRNMAACDREDKLKEELSKALEEFKKSEADVTRINSEWGAQFNRAEMAEANLRDANKELERFRRIEGSCNCSKEACAVCIRKAHLAFADMQIANERASKAEAEVERLKIYWDSLNYSRIWQGIIWNNW